MQISATCTSCPRAQPSSRNCRTPQVAGRTYLPFRSIPMPISAAHNTPQAQSARSGTPHRHARTSRYPCTKHAHNYIICEAGIRKHHAHHGTCCPSLATGAEVPAPPRKRHATPKSLRMHLLPPHCAHFSEDAVEQVSCRVVIVTSRA